MSDDLRNNVLAAIRKRTVFVYNPFSRSQSYKYGRVLDALVDEQIVICNRIRKAEWRYEKGPAWNHRA